MDFLGRPIKNKFDDDLDIQNNDLDGVNELQAKQINVQNNIICSELVINSTNVEDEIASLKQQVHDLQQVIKLLLSIDLN